LAKNVGCCGVEAIVTIDSKGQIVLPKDLREKAGLKPEDKLAIVACEEKGEVCCIIMVKADKLGTTIKGFLGPSLQKIFSEGGDRE
jgi:AbrB family looped-hinge helix DNA binding protein